MSAQAFPVAWPPGWPRTPGHKPNRGARFKCSVYELTSSCARDPLYEDLWKLGAKQVVPSTNRPIDGRRAVDSVICVTPVRPIWRSFNRSTILRLGNRERS